MILRRMKVEWKSSPEVMKSLGSTELQRVWCTVNGPQLLVECISLETSVSETVLMIAFFYQYLLVSSELFEY